MSEEVKRPDENQKSATVQSAANDCYISWDGIKRQWQHTDEERERGKRGGCYDCGLSYPNGNDCVVSNDIWEQINPTLHKDGGLLCANCIMARLAHLGISGIKAELWP